MPTVSDASTSVVTPYKGSVYIEPLFGSEQDTYLRLIYGSADNSTKGITPGLFWDLRSLPLPYQPLTPTPLKVITDQTGPGVFFRVQITREQPTLVPTTDVFDFVVESTEHVINVYLGKGKNDFDVYAYNTSGELQRIFSTSYVATDYATVLYTHALLITNYLWNPYNDLNNSLTAPGATGLVSPLISFDSELPESHNMFRSARQRVISVMMNQPNSAYSVQVFGGSVFQQTPAMTKPAIEQQLDINTNDWLQVLPSASQTHNTVELHVWQHDPELARWATYPRYLQAQKKLLDHSMSTTESTAEQDNSTEWRSTTKQYNPAVPNSARSWMDGTITYAPLDSGVLDFGNPDLSQYIPPVVGNSV